MYSLNSYYNENEIINLPECMYRLPNVFGGEEKLAHSDDLQELERRQEAILKKLDFLSKEVADLCTKEQGKKKTSSDKKSFFDKKPASSDQKCPNDLLNKSVIQDYVICANPTAPPLSVLVLSKMLSEQYQLMHASHMHCSVSEVPSKLLAAFSSQSDKLARQAHQVAITLIWKNVSHGPSLMVTPNKQSVIEGEACIARYLARHLNPSYEADIQTACEIDSWLDLAQVIVQGNKKEAATVIKNLNTKLGQSSWLVRNQLSLADVVMWSALQQTKEAAKAPNNVKTWLKNCDKLEAFQTACSAI